MGDHLSEMAILKTQDVLNPAKDVTSLNARMAFVLFVPFFFLGPLAGVLADRFPRRGLMISADIARFLIFMLFAALIGWTTDWGTWGPLLPLLPVGIFAALFSPARAALLPTLVRPDQLVRANGMNAGLGIIATMAAGLGGGYLAANYEPTTAFRVDAATFLVSVVLLAFIRPPQQLASVHSAHGLGSAAAELVGGFRYVLSHRRVRELLFVGAVVWFCGSIVNSVIPAVVRDSYDRGYQAMSGFRAFLGLGFILGATMITLLGEALRSEIAITWGLIGIGCSIALFSSSVFLPFEPTTLYVIGAIAMVMAGIFGVSVMASFTALLQRIVPDRYRGRVFGVRDLATTGALLTATGMLGIQQWVRMDPWVGHILLGVALLSLLVGVVTLLVRLRRWHCRPAHGLAWSVVEFVAKSWWRLRREGPMTVPSQGGVIVTANHTCSADPLFLTSCVRHRLLSFMVAAEYTTWPVFGYFMRVAECIPVRRETNDTGATKQAIRMLRAGKALGIFIEGRIVPPGQQGKPKDGVAMMALRTGSTVIPAHISGVVRGSGIIKGLMSRHRTSVRFGPPVDLSEFSEGKASREDLRAASKKIYAAVQALAPDAQADVASTEQPHEQD